MTKFRNHISRLCLFFVAIQILNMSIDAPNADLHTGHDSDRNFNYIDTFVEYIAEVVLKYDNAIPESKDRQQKELQLHKQFQFIAQVNESPVIFIWRTMSGKICKNYNNDYAFQFIKEINPPPPKA